MKLIRFVLATALAASAGTASAASTLKIATVAPDGTAWMREMRAAGEAIKTRTQGRVELKFYPGGVMGDDATVLRKMKIGQLQGGAFTGGEASILSKDAQVYSLPFAFRNLDEIATARSKLDPLLKASFADAGYELLGISGGGFAYLMSTRPIRSREDFKAAKVWVPLGDKIAEMAFSAAGVTPIPLPLSDVYTSLQTGLIDTAANTMSGALAFQWHTRIKHIVDLPLSFVVGELVVDKKAFDKIDAPDRAIVEAEVATTFRKLDEINRKDNEGAREALKAQGIAIDAPSDAARKDWEAIGKEVFDKAVAKGELSPSMAKALGEVLSGFHHGGTP